jgi:2-oxoglutarate dehydrogenase E2 component (dihydrolipoamide succinyltransferase)
MSITVELPALGESVVEGTIARWLVKQGDHVEVDQPLVEVTTDKVDAEIPAPAAGVIEKILVEEGDVVPVGGQLALIGEGAAASESTPASAPAPAPEEKPAAPEAQAAPVEAKATPVARRVAEDAQVDLGGVEGTGVAGRITKADVLRHAQPAPTAQPAAPAAAPAPAPAAAAGRPAYAQVSLEEGDRVIPMTPLRRLVAEHMVYSKHTSPHVGTVAEVDMSGVVRARRQAKDAFERTQGFRLTFLPFIVNAVVRALKESPSLNASVTEDAIVERAAIHMGIAVETDKGLMVPVIRHAERLSLAGQAAAIEDLSSRARSKKLSPDDLRGGTFTISNPGRQGNLYGFAIINQPQVGILRMGEMVKRPVVVDAGGEDSIAIRPMMHIALSYDHRAVDGAPANAFLFRVRELLEAADFDV